MDTTTESLDFLQLSNYAKHHAIAEYGQPPDDWHEDIYAQAMEEGPARGFHLAEIQFSGFSSQGDGASWTGHVWLPDFIEYHSKPEDADYAQHVVLRELIKDGWCEESVTISRNGFYYNHSGTMRSSGVDDRLYYADEQSVMDKGILEGANVQELAKSIDYEYLLNQLDEWLLSKAQKYADEIFKQLKEEYDHYTSEEYFKDLCDINGWRFDQRGILIQE